MKYILKILLLTILLSGNSFSQAQFNQVLPVSLDSSKMATIGLQSLNTLPIKTVNVDLNQIYNNIKDVKRLQPETYPVADAIPVSINMMENILVESYDSTHKILRAKLRVPHSKSLILAFDQFDLPFNTSLLIYDQEGFMVMGPLNRSVCSETRTYMTGFIPGPELIFELIVSKEVGLNNIKLNLSFIGFGVNADAVIADNDSTGTVNPEGGIVNKSNSVQSMPSPNFLMGIDQSDYTSSNKDLGFNSECISNNDTNFKNLINAKCLVIFLFKIVGNHNIIYTIGASNGITLNYDKLDENNCKLPYILTSGHTGIASDASDIVNSNLMQEYSSVRYNWKRMTPSEYKSTYPNAKYPNILSTTDVNSCKYPITFDDWKRTIKISEVIDYHGLDVIENSFRKKINGLIDLKMFQLRKKPLKQHNLFLAGWSYEHNGFNYNQNLKVLSNKGTYVQKYSLTNLFTNTSLPLSCNYGDSQKKTSLSLNFTLNIPNSTEGSGVSGSAVFNSNYQLIGLISTVDNNTIDEDFSFSLLYCGNNRYNYKSYLSPQPNSNNFMTGEYYTKTINNLPVQPCAINDTYCCEYLYTSLVGPSNDLNSTKKIQTSNYSNVNGNFCCNKIKIEESIFDNLVIDNLCEPIIYCDIYEKINGVNTLKIENFEINFNSLWGYVVNADGTFTNTKKSLEIPICEEFTISDVWSYKKYILKFKNFQNGVYINSCEKIVDYLCVKNDCNCVTDNGNGQIEANFSFKLIPKNSLNCCYDVEVTRKNESVCDISAIIPYLPIKINESVLEANGPKAIYLQDKIYRTNNPQNSFEFVNNKLILKDLCIDKTSIYSDGYDFTTQNEERIKFVIYQNSYMFKKQGNSNYNFDEPEPYIINFEEQKYEKCEYFATIPSVCNCCDQIYIDGIISYEVINGCQKVNFTLKRKIIEDCSTLIEKIKVQAFLVDELGNEFILKELYTSSFSVNDQTKLITFINKTFINGINDVKYRIIGLDHTDNVICSKLIGTLNSNICDNCSNTFSQIIQESCGSTIKFRKNSTDDWTVLQDSINNPNGNHKSFVMKNGTTYIYKIKIGACVFYFGFECPCCENDRINIEVIKAIDKACCYILKIKTNNMAECGNITKLKIKNYTPANTFLDLPTSIKINNSLPDGLSYNYSNDVVICNEDFNELTLNMEFFANANSLNNPIMCKKTIKLPNCNIEEDCCEFLSSKIQLIGPDANCCYTLNNSIIALSPFQAACLSNLKLTVVDLSTNTNLMSKVNFLDLVSNFNQCNTTGMPKRFKILMYINDEEVNSCEKIIELLPCSIVNPGGGSPKTSEENQLPSNIINIYPNPSDGTFNLEFNTVEKLDYNIDVMDVTGKLVLNYKTGTSVVGRNEEILKLNHLTNGTYYLNLKIGDVEQTEKIIINK